MRIRELPGWPPSRFEAPVHKTAYVPASPSQLIIESAELSPQFGKDEGAEVFLALKDEATELVVSSRFKIDDLKIAGRVARTLAKAKGRTLAEAGEIEIHPKGSV